MFLAVLNDTEKKLFVSLCMHGVTLGGKKANNNENAVMQAYCMEMSMPKTIECINNLDEVFEKINKESTDKNKRVMILELIGLMQSDDNFTDEKKNFMKKVVDKLDIAEATYVMLLKLWIQYRDVCQDLYLTIEGE